MADSLGSWQLLGTESCREERLGSSGTLSPHFKIKDLDSLWQRPPAVVVDGPGKIPWGLCVTPSSKPPKFSRLLAESLAFQRLHF